MNTKQISAIIIDPRKASVTQTSLSLDDDYSEFNRQLTDIIGCTMLDAVHIGGGDAIFVDDEGLLKEPQTTDTFMYGDSPNPLAGVGVIVGSNSDGESTDVKLSVDEVTSAVKFSLESMLMCRFPDGDPERIRKLVRLTAMNRAKQ